jgi:hypothetical protein
MRAWGGISQNALPFAEEKFSCVIEFRVIHKVTLSSPCLWACFHPIPSLSGIRKVRKFY